MAYTKHFPTNNTDPEYTLYVNGTTVLTAEHMATIRNAIQADETYLAEVDPKITALETVAEDAVTYAAQSGKTDAEKAQARDNVGAASETVLTAMASLTEYGAILEQQNYSRSGVTVVRTGTCSTINGTRDSSEIVRFRMYQAGTTRAGSVPTASQNISGGAKIKTGRTYRLCGRLVSGTYTPPETPIYYNDNWRLNAYYTGTTSAWNSRTLVRDGVNYVEECAPDADGEICVWLATIPNSTFTDAVLEIWLEDVTDVLRPSTIAAQEEPSSSSVTYHVGDLLTVGGTLYKATQVIAPGDTIAVGVNVAETSVAEQFADRVKLTEQTLTDEQKTQARENIDAASIENLTGHAEGWNLLAPLCNIHASDTVYGRYLEVNGCRYRKQRVSSSMSGNMVAMSLIGDTFHRWTGGQGVTDPDIVAQDIQDSDFVAIPYWMKTADWKQFVFRVIPIWRSNASTATNGRLFFATKDSEGTIVTSQAAEVANKVSLYELSLSWFGRDGFRDAVVANGNIAIVYFNSNSQVTTDQEVYFGIEKTVTTANYLAPEESYSAEQAHNVGELISYTGRLYKVTSPIAIGDTTSSKATLTTIAAQLAALEARIAALEG